MRHIDIVLHRVMAVVAAVVGAFVFICGDIGALVLGLMGAAVWIIQPQWLLTPSAAAMEEPPLGEPAAPPAPRDVPERGRAGLAKLIAAHTPGSHSTAMTATAMTATAMTATGGQRQKIGSESELLPSA
jgi:hypothetical protein